MRPVVLLLIVLSASSSFAQSVTQYFTATVSDAGTVNGFPVNSGDILTGSFTINLQDFTSTTPDSLNFEYLPKNATSGNLILTNNGVSWTFPYVSQIDLNYGGRSISWSTNSGPATASDVDPYFLIACPNAYNYDQNSTLAAGFPISLPSGCGFNRLTVGPQGAGGFALTITDFSAAPPTPIDPTPVPAPPSPTPNPPTPTPVSPLPQPIHRTPSRPPVQPAPPLPPLVLNPRIFMDGQDITDTNVTVFIGQQINLSATYTLAPGAEATNTWLPLPGHVVAGYERSPLLGKVIHFDQNDYSKPNIQFYWTDRDPENSFRVVTFTVSSSGQPPATVQATFEVSGPQPVVNQRYGETRISDPLIVQPSFSNYLAFLYKRVQPGANFVVGPTKFDAVGSYIWTQLVTRDVVVEDKAVSFYGCYLDTDSTATIDYLSSDQNEYERTDKPGLQLVPQFQTQSRDFAARMYLQWQPATPHSIPVPLGSWIWGYGGTTTLHRRSVPRGGYAYNWLLANTSRVADDFQSSGVDFAEWSTAKDLDISVPLPSAAGCVGRNPHLYP